MREKNHDASTLSTKVGRLLKPTERDQVRRGNWGKPLDFNIVYGYTCDGVMRSGEDSYHQLGMNRIDIALIHDVDVTHKSPADLWAEPRSEGLLNKAVPVPGASLA